jgi:predicted nucleic acid-binding Zn ribbon protein
MNTGLPLRLCVECGKPIMHRRTTAFYCSGKCRELHNARKRQQARVALKDAVEPLAPAASGGETDRAPKPSVVASAAVPPAGEPPVT